MPDKLSDYILNKPVLLFLASLVIPFVILFALLGLSALGIDLPDINSFPAGLQFLVPFLVYIVPGAVPLLFVKIQPLLRVGYLLAYGIVMYALVMVGGIAISCLVTHVCL